MIASTKKAKQILSSAFLLFKVLESIISEFQHFGIKVSSKSMTLFWFCVYIWVALSLKKTKVWNASDKMYQKSNSKQFKSIQSIITQFIWNYPIQWFALIRKAETSIVILEKKCLWILGKILKSYLWRGLL